jgi:hypothetical protein
MSSPLKIEEVINIGGMNRRLVFNMGTIVEMERLLGRSVVSELQKLGEEDGGSIRLDFLVAAIAAGIRKAHGRKGMTTDKVEAMLPNSLEEVGKLYAQVLPLIAKVFGADEAQDEAQEVDEADIVDLEKKAEGLPSGPSV